MERLDTYLSKLAAASFQRYGFGHGELVVRWPEIVGEALATHCEPVRIRWPRGGDTSRGGTLLLRAEPGRALEVEYQAPRMLERIGQYLGHGAITEIRVQQGPLLRRNIMKSNNIMISDDEQKTLDVKLAPVGDDKLKDALMKLGRGVLAAKPASPHGQ
jgi:hypothetical protein